jgi:DNA repair ATPase RecN
MLELLRDAYQFRLLNGQQLAAEIDRMERLERNRLDAQQRLRWALALSQTLQVQDTQKALGLVQEVLESPDEQSVALRPLAHLLGQMLREQRRLDAQNERLSQQLRDNQRRVEQLNDRLEAMRAIERSLNRPAPLPAAPRSATP